MVYNYIRDNKLSHVILFGSDRPIHSIARKICEKCGIKVLCFEEGYFRPDYVTLDIGGNNASSPLAGKLPDIEEGLISEAALKEKYKITVSEKSFRNKCIYGFLYYTCSELFSSNKQKNLFHKNLTLYKQLFQWISNFILYKIKCKKDTYLLSELIQKKYHLVALQLDSDMQSRFQSNGWKKLDVIHETIKSFANNCETESHLVFKVHPLERGHLRHEKVIKNIAQKFGIENRVWIIQTGSIGQWIKYSCGIITINSTSGFSAIFHGVPILLLGNAIYENEYLVSKCKDVTDIDLFWENKIKNNKNQRLNYLAWVKSRACVNGDFFTDSGVKLLSNKTIAMINSSL